MEPREFKPRVSRPGFSLVETLIGISLMGVVLVPMLFISSSYFLNQLNQTRQSMEVSHNSSQFLNRFMEQLYQATRVLSISDSTHLYFSYYDTVSQREIKEGYQLTTSGSNRILERLVYNTNSNTWDVLSPYSETEAQKLLLPNTAIFTYCQNNAATCTASSAQNALMVRLTGWNIKNATNTQTLNLPDIDVYVAAGASASDGVLLSEAPKEMYNVTATDAFGSNTDLTLFNLSPYTGQLNAMNANPLTTIISNVSNIGSGDTIEVHPTTGRVFLARGENDSNVWTWHSSTGLSTVFSGGAAARGRFRRRPDYDLGWDDDPFRMTKDGTMIMGERDGPAANSAGIWAWKDGVLTTIILNAYNPGHGWGYRHFGIGPDGRVYVHSYYGGELWTWKNGVLSTITNSTVSQDFDQLSPGGTDRLFWREEKTIYQWTTPNTMTTIVSTPGTATQNVIQDISAQEDGRVFYNSCDVDGSGDCTGNYRTYTWKNGVLTTIVNAFLSDNLLGTDGSYISGDYHFFTDWHELWAWNESGGLTTIPATDGRSAMPYNANGRIVLVSHSDLTSMYTWHPSTGLTMLPGGGTGDSWYNHAVAFVGSTDAFFFGKNNGRIYRWEPPNTVTTINPSFTVTEAGRYRRIAADPTGRVYFSGSASNTSVWTWHSSTGISTILSGITVFEYSFRSHPSNGVYFCGNVGGSHNCYFWSKNQGITMKRAMETGAPSLKNITFNLAGDTYVASVQDSDGNLFYVDSTNKTVDRYTSSTSSGTLAYSRATQFNWTTWASSVAAIAVDENSSKIALLDSGNKEIDVYANRLATGTPAAPTSFSVATQATLPTGFTQSNRTGNYVVVDSTMLGTNPTKYVKLYIYSSVGTYLRSYNIIVGNGTGGLAVDASAETNFKIALDSRRNVLYLASPSTGRVFALSMPEYL